VIYLDTSVLGAIFFREPNALAVTKKIEVARGAGLAISAWTLAEMASVGGAKERTGAIDHATRQRAMAAFQRFVSANLSLTEIEPTDFRSAALLLDGPGALRAGDALHLAIALRLRAELATLDHRLADAATARGFRLLALTP
jgi:uncharacterized protein